MCCTTVFKYNNYFRLCYDLRLLNSVFLPRRKLHFTRTIYQGQAPNTQQQTVLNVFDRKAKQLQRERAAISENVQGYDYLKDEIGYRLADRICDVKRKFKKVLNLGCSRGYISKNVVNENVEELVLCDNSELLISQAKCDDSEVKIDKVVCDEEGIEKVFKPDTFDLVISNLSLHWVNELPNCFQQVIKILKNDGVFLGSVFGGDTLYELRSSLQLAELERRGGMSPHISPFAMPRDIGNLLTRAGFSMQTIDNDEIVINYPSMFELISDLKGMGENNASWNRSLHLSRDTLLAASAIYKELYGVIDGENEGVSATFQIIYFIGWKPDPSQPKPAARGSADVSLKDLYNLGDVIKEGAKIPVEEK